MICSISLKLPVLTTVDLVAAVDPIMLNLAVVSLILFGLVEQLPHLTVTTDLTPMNYLEWLLLDHFDQMNLFMALVAVSPVTRIFFLSQRHLLMLDQSELGFNRPTGSLAITNLDLQHLHQFAVAANLMVTKISFEMLAELYRNSIQQRLQPIASSSSQLCH